VCHRLDRGEGRSQIVRHGREQRVLQPVRLAQRRDVLGPVQQLRRHDARREKREQHDPIEWIRDNQGIVRGYEENVEDDEGRRGRSEAKHASAARARSQYHEQKNQRDMHFGQHRPHHEHSQRAREQRQRRQHDRASSGQTPTVMRPRRVRRKGGSKAHGVLDRRRGRTLLARISPF